MRIIVHLLALICLASLALGQWVKTTIYLPDSLSGLDTICAVGFHAPNNTVCLGGNGKLLAVDGATRRERAGIILPGPVDLMCSSTTGNMLYCASAYGESVWVVDFTTNRFTRTVPLSGRARAMCLAVEQNKLYVACPQDSLVEVIDCATNSVVSSIILRSWPSALCYSPTLGRIYVARQTSDEVTVIDCRADTVVTTIWVQGVHPADICYDSVTNCVFTANATSGSVSVIDCAGDSLVRVVPAGVKPGRMVVGPEGKVYCGGYYDSILTVIDPEGTRRVPVGRHLTALSYDPSNGNIYCVRSDSDIVVIDGIGDTVVTRVAAFGALQFICYNPVDSSTWVAGARGATVGVIDGASQQYADTLLFGAFEPRTLCYSRTSNRLYCLARYLVDSTDMLLIVDGDSNRVLKMLPTGSSPDSMLWNPVNNKLYFSSVKDNTVSVLDCAGDSITETVRTGDSPNSMCCGADGKVYVTTKGGLAVIDPYTDTIRAVVPTPYAPTSLCYDRTDNKVYASLRRNGLVSVIDAGGDSIVASVPVPESCYRVCWNQNNNKVYVCADYVGLAVIDCTSDTVLRILGASIYPGKLYSDSAVDKIYLSSGDKSLYVFAAATDSLLYHTMTYSLYGFLDNGLQGAANRVYCTCDDYRSEGLYVISGAEDSVLRFIEAGVEPTALAWNTAHSWVYVSSSASSSITVVSDTALGVEENEPQVQSHKLQATVVRGALVLSASRGMREASSVLLDIGGRQVMELHTGVNDLRALAPGVYLVRSGPSALSLQSSAVIKVVVVR